MWFGRSWGAPCCEPEEHRDTPVGETCLWCDEAIVEGDQGMLQFYGSLEGVASIRPIHQECQMRSIVGGINHLRGTCSCCGGTEEPDPPGLTKRESAIQATRMYERKQRFVWQPEDVTVTHTED